jgi:diaminohydroxyphosphoribosylaminopyrimidine deaminase / 5-amino-6-(5-phosphoribosylamino)uracil reductase
MEALVIGTDTLSARISGELATLGRMPGAEPRPPRAVPARRSPAPCSIQPDPIQEGTGMTSRDDDRRWMELAIDLAHECPPSEAAYSVGAVIVDSGGKELSRGYSREGDPHEHAEESALGKLPPGDPRLDGATIYSTLEPCSQRRSRPLTCTQRILGTGIRRVVIAWLEPALFVADGQGRELLEAAGVAVAEMPELADRAKEPNGHLAL